MDDHSNKEKHPGKKTGDTHPPSHEHTKGESATTPPPAPSDRRRAVAIGLILAAVLLIVGGLVFTKLTHVENPPEPVPIPVKITLLVDATCTFCPKTNTILTKLDESHVQYELTTVDLHSEEGKALAEEFDLKYVPTALVGVAGLDQNTTIQGILQGQFVNNPLQTKKGWIIIPEQFLDKQPKLLTFIQKPTACEVPEGKILITAQLDYGDCKPCIEAQKILNGLTQEYYSLAIEYRPIMYSRPTLADIQNALATNKGAVCADRLGYLNEYTECNYFNAQFHGNLDIDFMKACIQEAGVNSPETQDEFVSCVQDENSGAEQMVIQNTKDGLAWNPLKYTPSFIIDCTYSFVGQKSLPIHLCGIHPELEGCEALIEATLNPPAPVETAPADENEMENPTPEDFSLVVGDANADSNALI
ncbi:MAG: hypothetical protein AABW68_05320 [archaeon]